MNKELLEIEPSFIAELWPDKREYWTCHGVGVPVEKAKVIIGAAPFVGVFYSKEDAETYFSDLITTWTWDGQPASTITLSDAMFNARRNGRAGVRVKTYSDGEWITVREYPANVPLPEELRDEA